MPPSPFPTPSSATTGFFQTPPTTLPQPISSTSPSTSSSMFTTPNDSADTTLSRLLTLYLPQPTPPSILPSLSTFASLVLHPKMLSQTLFAEINPPTLMPHTTFGATNTTSPLHTHPAWTSLKEIGIREGIVALAFEPQHSHNPRIQQFAKLHLWQGTAAMTTCPAAMSDGAAVLLGRHLNDPVGGTVFREARRRLISRDVGEAWTSGQWMTERSGGSDVSGTETLAHRIDGEKLEGERDLEDAHGMPLGPWRIDGFKWFSSATDSNMAILLARTTSTPSGLSVFFAPMRRMVVGSQEKTELNGVRIMRLKNKMGTKPVPTAELELRGMRGWLIGKEGEGVKEIAAILNITRLHTGSANVGYWGRALAVSRAYSRVRRVKGGDLLADNKQHVAWMAAEMVSYTAATHLVMFGAALLGVSENGMDLMMNTKAREMGLIPKKREEVELLLRIMTPLLKAQTTLAGTAGLRACMESLGGVGYLENSEEAPELNIARLFRDSVVGSIWEGTTSVMAEDVLRILKGRQGERALEALQGWVAEVWRECEGMFPEQRKGVLREWVDFKWMVVGKGVDELSVRGREVLERLESLVCSLLLMADAVRDKDEVAVEIARRWCRLRLRDVPEEGKRDWRDQTEMDRRIFLGGGANGRNRAKL